MLSFFSSFLDWMRKNRALLAIFLLALFFRVVWLETLPATFFVDEVLSGYLGRYLWENGKDLYGNPYPWLYFNKFGDYYIILPMYLDGLSTYLFGVTRFATRFPTALIGALAVFPIFGISTQIFREKKVGLLAALLLAITPWHVVLSRATTESVIELTLILTVLWTLLKNVEKKQLLWLTLALGFSLLSYLVYHTARLTLPLIWLGYLVIFFSELRNKKTRQILSGVVIGTILLFFLTAVISRTDWGKGRFEQTSLFSEQSGVSIRMQEMTFNLGPDSVLVARVFHNKLVGFGREFINQYISYLSPLFLFSDKAWLKTRYSVPETGPLYLSVALLLLAYILPADKNQKLDSRMMLFLLWLLALAPIPSSLTVIESPNVRRSLLLVAPLLILAAGGWWRASTFFWKSRVLNLGTLCALILSAEVLYFSYLYVWQSDRLSALYRTDGLPEVAQYLSQHSDGNEQFVVFESYDFPLYLLFEQQNFSSQWSEEFQPGLKIERMENVIPHTLNCAEPLSPQEYQSYTDTTFFLEPSTCKLDLCRFEEVHRIPAVNPLTYYRVLRSLTEPSNDPACQPEPLL